VPLLSLQDISVPIESERRLQIVSFSSREPVPTSLEKLLLRRTCTPNSGRPAAAQFSGALGHERTHALHQMRELFDHLDGAADQWKRNTETNGFCGLRLNRRVEPAQSPDWNIFNFCALENSIHTISSTVEHGR
jgi:hypothetical protein